MKRLGVIPTDPINHYINTGYSKEWLRKYFNPAQYFDEVYVFSPRETDHPDLLGMKIFKTMPEELPRRLREFNIDVLRAYGGMWPCTMACENRVPGIPVIVSIHDTRPDIFYHSVRKADFVFCAQQLKDFVYTRFKNRKRTWILPNGINFDVMRPYSREEASDIGTRYGIKTKYKIIQVGRRHKQKNLETLIRALKILGNDYSLLTSGKGDAQPYKDLATQEGVADRAVFIESIKNEEMPLHFAWADCLCHPTRWEGMSLLIVEALASAAIVVASDIPEMKGLINHGQNGLLVRDYENPQALADMVRQACTDEALRNTLRQNARQSVEQFEEGKMRELEANYYDKVLKMKGTESFKIPAWKEWGWNIEDTAKDAVPAVIKDFVKARITRR
jgi:glycosyltransferase involved in cell wall biosynthesis